MISQQNDKALKITWGKDANKREGKYKPTFQLPESIDEFLQEAGTPEKALDLVHDAYKSKAKGRIQGKLSTFSNGEDIGVVVAALNEVVKVSPFINLRGTSEATLVKNALTEIVAQAAGGEITLDMIQDILKRTRAADALADKPEVAKAA